MRVFLASVFFTECHLFQTNVTVQRTSFSLIIKYVTACLISLVRGPKFLSAQMTSQMRLTESKKQLKGSDEVSLSEQAPYYGKNTWMTMSLIPKPKLWICYWFRHLTKSGWGAYRDDGPSNQNPKYACGLYYLLQWWISAYRWSVVVILGGTISNHLIRWPAVHVGQWQHGLWSDCVLCLHNDECGKKSVRMIQE